MKLNTTTALFRAISMAFMMLAMAAGAKASFNLTLTQVGPNVVGVGSGTINLAALTLVGPSSGGGLAWGTLPGGGSAIGLGPPPSVPVTEYRGTITGSRQSSVPGA